MDDKRCSRCGEVKERSKFYKDITRPDGLNYSCKICLNNINTLWRKKNHEKIKSNHAEYYQQNKEKIIKKQKKYTTENHKKVSKYHKKHKKSLCKTKTLLSRLPVTDNAFYDEKGFLNVICKNCRKHFIPTNLQVQSRISVFEGYRGGECNFYCSTKCKNMCSVFNARTDSILNKNKNNDLKRCKTKDLKESQCNENNDQSHCEKCGDFIDVELHHTLPIAVFGEKSGNPNTHILLCAGCHIEVHSKCQ